MNNFSDPVKLAILKVGTVALFVIDALMLIDVIADVVVYKLEKHDRMQFFTRKINVEIDGDIVQPAPPADDETQAKTDG